MNYLKYGTWRLRQMWHLANVNDSVIMESKTEKLQKLFIEWFNNQKIAAQKK